MAKKKTETPKGTLRLRWRGLKPVQWNGKNWTNAKGDFSGALHAIGLFKAHKNLGLLRDSKNPAFLKGQLSPEGKPLGARINALPDGRKLSGAYSLFAKNLTIHDEASNEHWDVIYLNPSGKFAYLYMLSKKQKAVKSKYKKVKEFAKRYKRIMRKALEEAKEKGDSLSLAMLTLLKTMMRVGNEIYYKAHKHKGLTTLKKKDISIKGETVTFRFLSKGGVPRKITEEFPPFYVNALKKLLERKNKGDFVFISQKTGHPLKDTDFKRAFKAYCGVGFYPHIVRSYYATERAEEFLGAHKKATKEEVKELFTSIAEKLGHKKFSKKKREWEDSYTVTVHHYIQPELAERICGMAGKS